MKPKLYILFIAFFLVHALVGQRIVTGLEAHAEINGAKLIRYIERTAYPSYISFTPTYAYAGDISTLMKTILKLPQDYSLQLVKEEKDHIGFIHQEYRQFYKNIPVEYGIYKAHFKDNWLQSINGDIYELAELSTIPAITKAEAIGMAKDHMPAEKYKWEEAKSQSSKYYPSAELILLVENKKTFLTYKVDIYSVKPLARKFVYVNAVNGNVITETERIHEVDTPGVAGTVYSGNRAIISDFQGIYWLFFGLEYALNDTSRGITTINYSTSIPYGNTGPNWTYSGLDQYALDAHWGSEVAYDYYYNTYGRDGIDGTGYILSSYINEGPGFGNAYWDGSSCYYGDGDGITFLSPLTSLGIVGHEITHGLTQHSADLVYAGEPGALNESFSDIFGVAIDHYARSVNLNLSNTWLVGAECSGGIGIRSLKEPNLFNCADTYQGAFWNNGDIMHYDSGVQNFWFYLLTMGGAGTNDISNSFVVTGIGMDDAAAIAYRNLAYYLTPASDFSDSRFYSITAAEDLFGICSQQVESTTNAWYAVGVGSPYQNITTAAFTYQAPLNCSLPMEVEFDNVSSNAAGYWWDFGDGDTSTAENPSHFYTSAGTYMVQLIVNGCGTNIADTFSNNITIAPGSVNADMIPNQIQDINCCYGTLYDSGGPLGEYTPFELSYTSIIVPSGNIIEATFTSLSILDMTDFIKIYDGPDVSYPLIGSYTGPGLPNNGIPIYTSSNALFIEFDAFFDPTSNAGFEMNWHCELPSVPTSSFTPNDTTVCAGTQVIYTNTSSNGSTVNWDFQGGSPYSGNSNIAWVNYDIPGVYTTTLITSNAYGSDTSVSNITVYPLPTPAVSMTGNLLQVTPAYASYQWYNASLIPGATAQTYLVTSSSDYYYYCIVTDTNGCTAQSDLITNTFSLDNWDIAAVAIYPNPATTDLFIDNYLWINGNYSISITNLLGEIIYATVKNSAKAVLDITAIRAGTYFVNISQDDWEVTRKVIVLR